MKNPKQAETRVASTKQAARAYAEYATRNMVAGVGREAPVVTNEAGAKQSHVPYRCDLLPARATLAVAAVLHAGAEKYGPNNWRGIPTADHLNHALTHVFAFLAGDTQDDHLEHAACRLLMALEKHGELKTDAVAGTIADTPTNE